MAQTATPVSAPPRRRAVDVLRALGRPKVGLMLALGFSSGLPFMLIGNTLTFWLHDAGFKLAIIGFLTWISLTYSLKFLCGPLVDRVRAPLLGVLGRRRGWMVIAQIGVAAGLIGMACTDPRAHIGVLVGFGLLTGISAAAQDTVIDAWRIESSADSDELRLLTASYQMGYRLALIASEALILFIANAVGWPISYGLYGALMVVGIAAALVVREPLSADAVLDAKAAVAKAHPLRAVADAVVGPFINFFQHHGLLMAALTLGVITSYHLCDYMRGSMSNPYYATLGIAKTTIAWVRLIINTGCGFAGIVLGGVALLRLGTLKSLVLGAILQPAAVAAFALLAWRGGDFALLAAGPLKLTAFELIMAFDSLAMAFSGVVLVAYMSTLTSLGYTATQYALLTSALTWTGKTLKGFSGLMVEALHQGRTLLEAYGLFYLWAAALGLPALALCLVLVRALGSEMRLQSVRQTT